MSKSIEEKYEDKLKIFNTKELRKYFGTTKDIKYMLEKKLGGTYDFSFKCMNMDRLLNLTESKNPINNYSIYCGDLKSLYITVSDKKTSKKATAVVHGANSYVLFYEIYLQVEKAILKILKSK